MGDKLTAVGICRGITEKPSGWKTIEIALPGKDYPLKLDTKIDKLVDDARAVGGNVATWTYSESDSGTPNPNRPGTNFINRRLEGVEEGALVGATTASGNGATPSSDQMTKEDWERKDNAGHLRACIAIAVSALSHTMPSDPNEEDLAKFIRRVGTLSESFHRQVLLERSGDGPPF